MAHIEKTGGTLPALGVGGRGREVGESRGGGGVEGLVVTPSQ